MLDIKALMMLIATKKSSSESLAQAKLGHKYHLDR